MYNDNAKDKHKAPEKMIKPLMNPCKDNIKVACCGPIEF